MLQSADVSCLSPPALLLLPLVAIQAQTFQPPRTNPKGLISLDSVAELFTSRQKAALSSVGLSRESALRVQGALIELQKEKAVFLDALKAYASAVERSANVLEVDFKYADVGESAKNIVLGIESLNEALSAIQAPLDLDRPEIGAEIRDYMHQRGVLTGQDILRDHFLRGMRPKELRDVVQRAETNSQLLERAISDLRLFIKKKFPD